VSAETFYRDVAKVALTVAGKHGFVLGGGVAWLVNGLVDRPTEDVDLFTDTAGGVAAAAGEVTTALTEAGYRVAREEGDELFAGMDEDLREFVVSRDGQALRLTLCRLDRQRAPVVMDLGPVMHLDDLIATKVAALVNRREVRDYIDVAAALEIYPLAHILELAGDAECGCGCGGHGCLHSQPVPSRACTTFSTPRVRPPCSAKITGHSLSGV